MNPTAPAQTSLHVHVLFVSNEMDLGGGERSLLTVLRGAETRQPRPEVTLLCRPGAAIGRAAKDAGIPVIERPLLQRNLTQNPRRYLASLRATAAAARATGADIIFADGWRSVPLAVPVATFLRRKAHVHLREINVPPSPITRKLVRLAEAVTLVSHAQHRFMLSHRIAPADRFHVVHNGVEPSHYLREDPPPSALRQSFGLGPENLGVVLPGSLLPGKGGETFIKLARELSAAYPHARFFFAGSEVRDSGDPANEGFGEVLRQLVHKAGLSEQVQFLGHRDDLADVFWAMDLVVLPTHYEEAFGRVSAEAMLAGRAIVVFNSGGLAEVIVPDKTGLLVDKGNFCALATATIRLLGDSQLRKNLGDAGRRHALNHFTSAHKVAGMWKVMESLVVR